MIRPWLLQTAQRLGRFARSGDGPATSPTPAFNYLVGITETYGVEGCPGRVGYRLSLDGVSWYYDTAGKRQASNGTVGQLNISPDLTVSALAQFSQDVGAGSLHLQGALRSDGSHACDLSAITVPYIN